MRRWYEHLNDKILEDLVTRSGITPEEVAHFVQCDECQRRAKTLPIAKDRSVTRLLLELKPLIAKIREAPGEIDVADHFYAMGEEIAEAKGLVLRAAATEHPEEIVRGETVMPEALAQGVLEAAAGLRQTHPERLITLARLGLDRLEQGHQEGRVSSQLRAELEGQLLAELGNAHRILGRFAEADRALRRARELVLNSREDLPKAHVAWLSATYLEDIRQFDRAERQAQQAIDLYRRVGNQQLLDVARFRYATIAFVQGDLEEAERRLLAVLASVEDPFTELSACFRLAKTYTLQGNPFAGAHLLKRVRELADAFVDSPNVWVMIEWLQALILGGTLSPLKGAELLKGVRDHYLKRGILVDAGLASVDLSMLLLQGGKPQEAAEIAAQALEAFRAQPVDFPQALAALRIFEEAIREDKLCHTLYRDTTLEMIRFALDRETQAWVKRKYG